MMPAGLNATPKTDPMWPGPAPVQRRRVVPLGEQQPRSRHPRAAGEYGVSRATAAKAVRRLADDGLVEVVSQWGTFST